jgi:NAD(P)H-flavin reductase
MHADEGTIPEPAQKDLKPALKKQGLFLSCQCRPEGDMRVSLPDGGDLDVHVTIAAKEMLNGAVLRVRLTAAGPFACEPGQYITLITGQGLARSYSIANDPSQDGFVELHVRLVTEGRMSAYLRAAQVGEELVMRGPAGNCFYVPEEGADYPIILAGTGTGLAPLYGVLRAALDKGHKGAIRLFHGALHEPDLYLVGELQALAERHANFRYTPCVLHGAPGQYYVAGNIETAILSELPVQKALTRLFICGAPEFVNALRRKAFLAGLASKHIAADAFIPANPILSAA